MAETPAHGKRILALVSTKPLVLLLGVAAAACAEPGTRSPATHTDATRAPASPEPDASASARVATDMQSLVGKSLGDAASALRLEERAFRYVDEPPGKLKVVTVAPEPGTELEVHLHYDSALLFSEDRDWPLSRIGGAKVLGLVERRGRERRVFGEIHARLSRP